MDLMLKALEALEGSAELVARRLNTKGYSYLRFAISRVGGMSAAAKLLRISPQAFAKKCRKPPRHWLNTDHVATLAEAADISVNLLIDSEALTPAETKLPLEPEVEPEPPKPCPRRKKQ